MTEDTKLIAAAIISGNLMLHPNMDGVNMSQIAEKAVDHARALELKLSAKKVMLPGMVRALEIVRESTPDTSDISGMKAAYIHGYNTLRRELIGKIQDSIVEEDHADDRA